MKIWRTLSSGPAPFLKEQIEITKKVTYIVTVTLTLMQCPLGIFISSLRKTMQNRCFLISKSKGPGPLCVP